MLPLNVWTLLHPVLDVPMPVQLGAPAAGTMSARLQWPAPTATIWRRPATGSNASLECLDTPAPSLERAHACAAGGASSRSDERQAAVARTYSYDTEKTCDRHRDIFMDIRSAAEAPGQGFAAIKVLVHTGTTGQHFVQH